MGLYELIIARIGTKNMKINALEGQISECEDVIHYHEVKIKEQQDIKDACESQIEKIRWSQK